MWPRHKLGRGDLPASCCLSWCYSLGQKGERRAHLLQSVLPSYCPHVNKYFNKDQTSCDQYDDDALGAECERYTLGRSQDHDAEYVLSALYQRSAGTPAALCAASFAT